MGYWVIRTYEANGVVEKTKYYINADRPPKSVSRKAKSEIKKQEQNTGAVVKTVARLFNQYIREGDVFVCLSYNRKGYSKLISDMPGIRGKNERREWIWTKANHEMALFFRRVKYELGKSGKDVWYLGVTSDENPRAKSKDKKAVRVHHHIVMSASAAEAIKKKWSFGSVHVIELKAQKDYTDIASYMIKQVRHVKDRKKYTPSRNLKNPEPKDRIAQNYSELRVPAGAELLFRAESRPGRPQYLRYVIPRKRFDILKPHLNATERRLI